MPDFCSASGCSNKRGIKTRSHGITFHRFPKDGVLRKRWQLAVRWDRFVATERSLLCSEHFKSHDFDRTGQTVRLRPDVIPSVFNFPTSLQKKEATRTTLTAKKAEESVPVDRTRPPCEVEPPANVDHSYALPTSPAALKARLCEALARVESLEREKRNAKIRELRAKKNMRSVLEGLREKNLLNEKLPGGLECYAGHNTGAERILASP
ncbi:THAP domain-containing protein 6-like [Xenentodon cancila]